jgi:hypothetical protein
MKAEIKDNKLILTMDLQNPAPSKSGKTLIVATTNGFFTSTAQLDGKPIVCSVNCYVKK